MRSNSVGYTSDPTHQANSLQEEFDNFDRLPREWRQAICEAPNNLSATSLFKKYDSDYARKIAFEAKMASFQKPSSTR